MALRCPESQGGYCAPSRKPVFTTAKVRGLAFIQHPNVGGIVPLRQLHKHLPELYYSMRENGARTLNPASSLRPKTYRQQELLEWATTWIFAHVNRRCYPHCHRHQPDIPGEFDIFEQCLTEFSIYHRLNPQVANEALDDAFETFEAVSLLLGDYKYGHSPQLFESYFDVALRLVAMTSSTSLSMSWPAGELVFGMIQSVYEASGKDFQTTKRLIRQFGVDERDELLQEARIMASRGHLFAISLLNAWPYF